jgi:flagellar basal-body rod protein FlgC
MINAIQIALSGLNAASRKADAAASNIANLTTSGALDPADGPAPYNAVTAVQTAITGQNGESLGVRSDVVPTNRPFVPAYDPDSPFANSDGLIGTPNVDLATEIVNLQLASTTYKANAKTIEVTAALQDELLSIFDRDA